MKNNGDRVAIIDACRTPFQRSGTGYYDIMAWEIGRYAVQGLLSKCGVPSSEIDYVIMGTVASDISTTNVAREIALGAGLPESIPANTCTVACISSNMAITGAVDMIRTGNASVVIAGGVESFSDPDIKVSKAYRRFILDMTMFKRPKTLSGKLKLLKKMHLKDFVIPEKPAVGEYSTGLLMGQNADRLAGRLSISRDDQDRYAERSHALALAAMKSGKFKEEIVPVVLPNSNKAIADDNGPREDTKYESIRRLRSSFTRRYGTVTAANSSFLTDGASAVLLMSEKKAKQMGLKPRAYIRSYAHTAQNVIEELLLGPAFAIPQAISKAGIRFRDVGVWEIHEAFAAQMLGVIQSLQSDRFCRDRLGMTGKAGIIDMDKVNAWGGSLSIGHPFGATGGRLVACCCDRMRDAGERFGIVAGCAAGAIGNAMVIENGR